MAGWQRAVIVAAGLIALGAVVRGEKGTGAITGRVVDRDGRPIAGAEVWHVAFSKRVGLTRTDADGRFRLGGLKPDKAVTVWADAPGLARGRSEEFHIFAGRDREIRPVVLLPGTKVRGRVVDAEGRPIAGAKVQVRDLRHVLGHTVDSDQTEWTLTSDPEGCFQTVPLPAGQVWFSIRSPGKVRGFPERWIEPGTREVDLGDVTLADEVPIRGVVVDQEGTPAPGVKVTADYDHEFAVTTDREGRFVVHGAGKDTKQLTLQANDYFAPKPIDLGPERDALKLTVIKAYEIQGTAIDAETGKPVRIGTVRLCTVERDPDGSYNLLG